MLAALLPGVVALLPGDVVLPGVVVLLPGVVVELPGVVVLLPGVVVVPRPLALEEREAMGWITRLNPLLNSSRVISPSLLVSNWRNVASGLPAALELPAALRPEPVVLLPVTLEPVVLEPVVPAPVALLVAGSDALDAGLLSSAAMAETGSTRAKAVAAMYLVRICFFIAETYRPRDERCVSGNSRSLR